MQLPTPAARYLGPADRGLLAGMGCSTGAWFENDVETFIQTSLADYHDWRRAHTGHTIVGLELDDVGLIAVGSHEAEFVRDGGQVVTSTYLECAAVRTDLQGAVLPEVDPLDDDRPVTLGRYILEALLSDIAEVRLGHRIVCEVAKGSRGCVTAGIPNHDARRDHIVPVDRSRLAYPERPRFSCLRRWDARVVQCGSKAPSYRCGVVQWT